MRILAVDDKPDNIEMIVDIVEALGYEVSRAFSGVEALEAVETAPPDLILLDVNMPGMSGFEVVERLKGNEKTASIPVIMLTALTDVDYRVEGLGLGADDYLTKPYSARELVARIETRLRAKTEADNLRQAQVVIRNTFERFVSPSVVQQLLRDPSRVELGGRMQQLTVFFADLQGFTAAAEYTEPDLLLSVLNQYHELIVYYVQLNEGTVDKFIGDEVMALYNTPLELEDHPLRAVRTAYQIKQALTKYHEQFEPHFRMKINFGIHTGTAVVGNIGAPQIMDYTAVGDSVNVAARLQKFSNNGQILISEATYAYIQEHVTVRSMGPVTFKGRSVPVMTYEVDELVE
jgi:class 3 adenylate cyclase